MHTNSVEDTNIENNMTVTVGTMLILPYTPINARIRLSVYFYSKMLTILE